MHLRPFGWLTKLDGKRAELMQKFVPRSRVRIFCNERTRSTPLDPKLMFWCVLYYFGAFGTVFCPTTLSAKWVNIVKSSCHEVALEFFATNTPDPPHWTLNFCFRAICTIFCAFETIWLPYKTRCRTGRTSAKFHATKSHRNFSQRTHLIHTIGP